MNQRMLINVTRCGESHPEEVRLALLEKTKLIDLDIEDPRKVQKVSNIYKGRISSIEPSLGAVFVDYGSDRHGFLPLKEVSSEYFLAPMKFGDKGANINQLLRVGQEVVVQLEKEERDTKGAALTTFISLAGSYLVLMPNNPRAGGISRRISGDEREEVRTTIESLTIPDGMGIIIRTAGLGKNKDELEWDLEILLQYWEAIKRAAVLKPAPYLIHQESDVIVRAVRDYLRKDIVEIIIDDAKTFERVQNYIGQVRPDYQQIVKLYDNTLPLFSHYNVEQQIEAAYQREVRLPAGGSMVIDHTEALIAVDINSARATKGVNIEETAFQTNLEAAEEIARQLRIRDIGGLVVIDFIDMLSTNNQREVENRLRNSLRNDRARIQLGRISRFGLMEMSRQRIRSPLKAAHQITCESCAGRGTIRTVESVSMALVRLIEEQAVKAGSAQIQIQAPVDIATFLLNEKRLMLRAIQERTASTIVIIPNHHLQSPDYSLKLIKDEHTKNTSSYKLVKIPRIDASKRFSRNILPDEEPAINQFLADGPSGRSPSSKRASSGDGLIKRLWETIFGSPVDTPPQTTAPRKQTRPATRKSPSTAPRSRSKQRSSSSQAGTGNSARKKSTGNDLSTEKSSSTSNRRGTRGGSRTSPRKTTTDTDQSDGNRQVSSGNSRTRTQTKTSANLDSKQDSAPNKTATEKQQSASKTSSTQTNRPKRKQSTTPRRSTQRSNRANQDNAGNQDNRSNRASDDNFGNQDNRSNRTSDDNFGNQDNRGNRSSDDSFGNQDNRGNQTREEKSDIQAKRDNQAREEKSDKQAKRDNQAREEKSDKQAKRDNQTREEKSDIQAKRDNQTREEKSDIQAKRDNQTREEKSDKQASHGDPSKQRQPATLQTTATQSTAATPTPDTKTTADNSPPPAKSSSPTTTAQPVRKTPEDYFAKEDTQQTLQQVKTKKDSGDRTNSGDDNK